MKHVIIAGQPPGNIGDELLVSALRDIIGNDIRYSHEVMYGRITLSWCTERAASHIIIAGGSMFNVEPNIEPDVIREIPIAYISVGFEGAVHPRHATILRVARLVVHRSPMSVGATLKHHIGASGRWESLPDIVFACATLVPRKNNILGELLYIPNIDVMPRWSSPHAMHLAWDNFATEFSHYLDGMWADGWNIRIGTALSNETSSDAWAGGAILARCNHRHANWLSSVPLIQPEDITGSSLIISQRYHGIVLGVAARVPTIGIHHVDKLRPNAMHHPPGASLPYNGVTREGLHAATRTCLLTPPPEPPNRNDLIIVYRHLIHEFLGIK